MASPRQKAYLGSGREFLKQAEINNTIYYLKVQKIE